MFTPNRREGQSDGRSDASWQMHAAPQRPGCGEGCGAGDPGFGKGPLGLRLRLGKKGRPPKAAPGAAWASGREAGARQQKAGALGLSPAPSAGRTGTQCAQTPLFGK